MADSQEGNMTSPRDLVTSDSIIADSEDIKNELETLFETEFRQTHASRIAVLSDIHSNITAFEAVLGDLDTQDYDIVINLGDLVGYYTHPNEVMAKSVDLFDFGVMGNHDFAAIEPENLLFSTLNKNAQIALQHNKDILSSGFHSYLRSQPMKMVLQTNHGDITMVHGDPLTIFGYIYGSTPETMTTEIMKALAYVDTEFLFVGHTHIQGKLMTPNKIYVNPGAVGQPRDGDPRAAYSIVDLEEQEIDLRRVKYDISEVQSSIHQCQFPTELGTRLEKGV